MRALAGWVVVAALALSGCGGSSADQPQSLPTLASAAPSTSPPTSPPSAGAAVAKDAAAFVKSFYAQITAGFQQRDPSLVSDLSLPTCKTCKLYIDSITELRDKNQRLQGGGFKIVFAVAPGDTNAATARVDVKFDFAEARVMDANGGVVQRTPAQAGVEEQVALTRVGAEWRVATIKRVVRK
jgi:hypothetical protein